MVASATVLLDLARPPVHAVLGHSVGDLAALTVAGALTPEQAVRLLHLRDRLLRDAALPAAGLLATDMTADRAAELLRAEGLTKLRIAARNAPAQTVLAGPADQLAAAGRSARELGHRATELTSRTAYHHPCSRRSTAPSAGTCGRSPSPGPNRPCTRPPHTVPYAPRPDCAPWRPRISPHPWPSTAPCER